MQERFVSTRHSLSTRHSYSGAPNKRLSASVFFVEEDPKTYEDLHWFCIRAGIYVEYGDQGNGRYDAVKRLELSPKLLRITFKPEAQLTSWDYFMRYTPGRVWDPERDGDVILTELTIQFSYSLSAEEWDTLRTVMSRVAETDGSCEYTVTNE